MEKYYVVLRLNTTVKVADILGRMYEIKMPGAGYLPVYTNKKEAVKASEKGKYKIMEAETPEYDKKHIYKTKLQ